MKKKELKEFIERYLGKEFFLGEHGSFGGKNVINSIMSNGLSLRTGGNYHSGCNGTLTSNGRANEYVDDALEYTYGGAPVAYICAFPIELENEYGEKIFCGYSEKTWSGYPKDQKDYECLMTKLCDALGYIPVEFILATNVAEENYNREYHLNPKHYSGMGKEERQAFFRRIKRELEDKMHEHEPYSDGIFWDVKKVLDRLIEIPFSLEEANKHYAARELDYDSYEDRMLTQKMRYEKETHMEVPEGTIKEILTNHSKKDSRQKNWCTVELGYGNMFDVRELDDTDGYILSAKKRYDDMPPSFFITFRYSSKESEKNILEYTNSIQESKRFKIQPYLIDDSGKATSTYTGIVGGMAVSDRQSVIALINEYFRMGCKVKIGDMVLDGSVGINDEELMKYMDSIELRKKSLSDSYQEAIEESTDLSYRLGSIDETIRAIKSDLDREEKALNENKHDIE
ncbi:MAG: hypothetical protein IKE01_02980 [Clostridia bacterium]|nr:hypothetical protein [Clostridia bacterium]